MTTTLRGSISTINETSFAVAYGDAQALVLDGLALIGGARAEKFAQAKHRAETALGYVHDDNAPEVFLVRQFLAYIALVEQRRWNY